MRFHVAIGRGWREKDMNKAERNNYKKYIKLQARTH